MPYIQPLVTPQGRHGIIFNLEQSVGSGGTNAREDVRLVQELLRITYGKRAEGMIADGWIGPTTTGWIKRFQEDAAAAGNRVLIDGRVDRALGAASSVSKTVYTIMLLNLWAYRVAPQKYNSVPSVVKMSATPKASPYSPQKLAPKGWSAMYVKDTYVLVVFEDGREEAYSIEGGLANTPEGKRKIPGEGYWRPDGNGQPTDIIVPESGGF